MPWEDIQEPDSAAPKIGKLVLPNDWHQAVLDASQRHGIDPAFAQAVMAVESNYKPSATSKKGAMGLMQLMPDTARQMGVQDPYNPIQNIEGGIKLLGQLNQRFNGDLQKVAWVYNAGSLGKSNPETAAYVPAVMAAYRQAKGQSGGWQEETAGQGKWIDVEEKPPQPNQIQSIPDMFGSAIGPDMAAGQNQNLPTQPPTLEAQPDFTPGISESLNQFQPQQIVPGLGEVAKVMNTDTFLNQLPTTGMIAGGTIGGLSGGGLGAVPGAALGAGAGKAAELYFKGRKGQELPSIPSQAMQIGTAGLTGATAEMGGQVAGKALESASAPGRKWLSDQLANIGSSRALQDMANQGVPISPSLIAPSKTAKTVTWLAERFQPGKSIVDSYRKQTMDMIMDMRRNLIEEMGLPPVGSQALGTSQQSIKNVFSQFKNAAGSKTEIPLPNTKAYLENLNNQTSNISQKFLDETKAQLASGTATIEQIERINASLWPKGRAYGKMSATDKGWREEFLQNMYKDLGAQEENLGVNLANLLQSAKGTARKNYQAQYLEGLLDRATNNETMQFNPQLFADLVKKNERQIFTRFDPEQRQYIFNFSEKMKAVAPERALFKEGREKTDILSWVPGAGLGAATYANLSLAVPIGFQAIVARSLMNPKGVVRTWLTKGFEPPTLPVKIGIMEEQK